MKPPQSRPYQPRSAQIAGYLRKRLAAGEWSQRLPGERLLAQQVGVSRRTLREALETLQQEGWVASRSRLGTRVKKPGGKTTPRALSVGLLLPVDVDHLRQRTILWIGELRRILYARQIELQVYQKQFATPASSVAFFRKLTKDMRHDCWVLPYSNPPMQRWCAINRVPAVIVGALHENAPLPHVDVNYRAACHHAAMQMLRLGHRRLVLVLDRLERGGDIESRLGFQEAANHARALEVSAAVAHHDGTVSDLRRLADRLLAAASRPTAWLIADPACFLTIMTHLLGRGVRIPETVSLVCRDADPYLAYCTPEPSRYVADATALAKQIARITQKIAAGHPSSESASIIPELIQGQTLAAPAKT